MNPFRPCRLLYIGEKNKHDTLHPYHVLTRVKSLTVMRWCHTQDLLWIKKYQWPQECLNCEPLKCDTPPDIYLFKVNNRNTRTMCFQGDFTHCSGVSIVDFEQVNAGWFGQLPNQLRHKTQTLPWSLEFDIHDKFRARHRQFETKLKLNLTRIWSIFY